MCAGGSSWGTLCGEEVFMQIGHVPRVHLGAFPTPLQPLRNLTKLLGGPELFIKRDDMTGLGLGGNKLRKLEYALAEARQRGATALITTGATQSNHVRLTAAAGNHLGLKTYLVLRGDRPERPTGNLLIDEILGVEEIRFVPGAVTLDKTARDEAIETAVERLATDLRDAGETPYYIPNGCRALHGALGYSGCVMEIVQQLHERDRAADGILTACGTTSTQTGLILGATLYGRGAIEIIGISVAGARDLLAERIADGLAETCDLLQLERPWSDDQIVIHDGYIGDGYGCPTPEMLDAVRLVARTEGILLDPVYTGKAMAGLIDLIRQHRFREGQTVVFLHTGGAPGLFAEAQAKAFLRRATQPD
jgi:D-cysteine desulfhydrase family pyridoxal phosphate-dependent enzyme